jgi:cation-transporting ATPase E
MYSIEMLASADVICLDKTGTITDGTMCVDSVEALNNTSLDEINRAVSLIEGAEDSQNNTSKALIQYFGKENAKIIEKTPFSSSRKYSAIQLESGVVYAIGAPNFVPCSVTGELDEKIRNFASEGLRVLLLAKLPSLNDVGEPMALITISGKIRPGAKQTIENFQNQDVKVKIISGDHAATVSYIAKKVGVINAEKYISCENISDEELVEIAEDYVVFGRVTPEQKVLIIKALKSNGHTVAMTGDGVNDTLALKESNCAIAMAEGSEVAKKVSQIVLLKSDFSTLPDVVREGRRCINNVRGSAVLFLMKTVFTILLSIFAISTVSGYPFEPKQFMLLEMFVIGAASFLLALEPNNKRITGTFLRTVLVKSVPLALVMFIPVLSLMLLCRFNLVSISDPARNSLAMIMVTLTGFINLISVCRPFTKWRAGVCAIVGVGIVGVSVVSIFMLNDILSFLPALENTTFMFAMIGVAVSLALFLQLCLPTMEIWVNKFAEKIGKNKKKKKKISAK